MIDPLPDNDWDEVPKAKKARPDWRFQFSLRTLLLFVTGTAVFCSLCAWLGTFPWICMCGAVGAIVGMIAGLRFGLDTQIDHLPREFVKCLFASVLLLSPCWYVISAGLAHGRVFMSVFIVVGFVFKLLWQDYGVPEIAWVEISMLFAMAVGTGIGAAVVGA